MGTQAKPRLKFRERKCHLGFESEGKDSRKPIINLRQVSKAKQKCDSLILRTASLWNDSIIACRLKQSRMMLKF